MRMQFQWCGNAAFTQVDGRAVPLPRKALALLAYLCLETGPHSRGHLSALLWPESDDVHAAMSLRQALSKLRELLGDALVADRQQVSLHRQEMPLADICDVHRFEALLARDPLTACRTDVHRFLDALTVDDAPEFVHWVDRTRSRLRRSAVSGLRRAAEELRAQRNWMQLRAVGERWLAIEPVSLDAACHAIEAAFLTRDAAGATALRDLTIVALSREEMNDDASLSRLRELVHKYERVTHGIPVAGVRAASASASTDALERRVRTGATAWADGALRERQAAWQSITDTFSRVPHSRAARWITLAGGIGAGRSRLMRDMLTVLVERGAAVMTTINGASGGGAAYTAIASLLRSVIREDALAGVDERTLRTLFVLVPELSAMYPVLRRSVPGHEAGDGVFAVQLQEALAQVCLALAEERPLVIALDDAMHFDRESTVALQALTQRIQALPVLWLFTDADDAQQSRENGPWAAVVQGGDRVALPPMSVSAVERMLAEGSGHDAGWEPLATRVHAATHGMPGSVVTVLQQLEAQWGVISPRWQEESLEGVPIPAICSRMRGHFDALDAVASTILLSLALVMEPGHPVAAHEWRTRPVLSLDDLSHIHGISRLRAAVLGARLVECRLAVEAEGGFRCASPMVVAHAIATSSQLVLEELRRLVRGRL
jgi:DNA-binding SARP family transcriptional activator